MPRRRGADDSAEEDEDSSDAPLTKALREAAAPECTGEDVAEIAEDLLRSGRINWRKRARKLIGRKEKISKGVLDSIRVALGCGQTG